ncbi:FG-GAP-like repeat-containing protein [Marinoscillum furvescens]|nr:FG-GAP-like repeat-containing protein [Marinoscillum furvescens]
MKYIYSALFLGLFSIALAQKPIVVSLDKYSATVDETIFINGANFPTNVANVSVFFGNGKATVTSAAENQLQVTVTNTATFGPVRVVNTSNGLAGASGQPFMLSYSGDALDASKFVKRSTTTSEQGTYDVCVCDFNDNGKLDAAVANFNNRNISIFNNLTTFGNQASFSKSSLDNVSPTISVECGDLNGDGLPDLVATSFSGSAPQHVKVYQNNGTAGISFTKVLEFRLPNLSASVPRNPRKIKIADMDLDGKSDLIIGSENDNSIFIYQNTTTGGTLSFASSPESITVSGADNAASIEIGDLNNDGLPDIAAVALNIPNSSVFVIRNQSSPGSFNFIQASTINDSNQRTNVSLVDIDGDFKPEIITTNNLKNDVDIFENTTSGIEITFDNSPTTLSVQRPWSVASGDLNGDGKVDLSVATLSADIYVLENTTSNGSIAFTSSTFSATPDNRNIELADIDGDAKPDVITTNNTGETATGSLLVMLNQNCTVSKILPEDLTFCLNEPITLRATNTRNATYSWAITSGNGNITGSGQEVQVTVTSGETATVQVTTAANDGSCSEASSQVFSLTGGTPPPTPSISNSASGTICSGDSFTLTASTATADEYYWVTPSGDQITTTTNTLEFSDVSSADAGNYTVRTFTSGSCTSAESPALTVAIDEPPSVVIASSASTTFCANSTINLIVPDYDGYSYQWHKDGTDLTGETANTFTANASGSYTVTLTSNATSCSKTSGAIALTAVELPVGNIASEDEICVNAEISFDGSGSTSDPNGELTYSWDFGDGNTADTETANHTYTTDGSYTVTLTTGYSNVNSCESTTQKTVEIAALPSNDEIAAALTPDPSTTQKCPEDSLTLSLPTNYLAYEWTVDGDVVSTTNSAKIGTAPKSSSTDVTIDVTTDLGCVVDATVITVSNLANAGFTFSSPDAQIVNDTITLDDRTAEVTLQVSNGTDFTWSPEEVISSTSGEMIDVYPRSQYTTVTVTGTDTEGCTNTSQITIVSPGLIPRKSFSPNGDGIGYECWEILNSESLTGCTIFILDQKGSHVLKAEAPFVDNCVWNGNIDNGTSPVPEGVYYYILKCDDGADSSTGTIMLAR